MVKLILKMAGERRMLLLNEFILLCLCLFTLVSLRANGQTSAPTKATTYLQQTSDRYQQSVDVYREASHQIPNTE